MPAEKIGPLPWLAAILLLPGNVLLLFPALLLCATRYHPAAPPPAFLLTGSLSFLIGLSFAIKTMLLFHRVGHGTAAPWHPPVTLVTCGPYAYVRNPMIASVLLMLTGESLLTRSWPLAAYTLAFFLLNCAYFRLFEEKQLEKRFGNTYRLYKKITPMWLPKVFPRPHPAPPAPPTNPSDST